MAALDLEEVYDRYGDVWREGMDRWRDGINQIRAGTYEPKQLFKDMVYLWVEGTIGPWVPSEEALPTLRMDVSRAATQAFGSKRVRSKGPGPPTVPNPLARSDGGAALPANQVTAAFTENNTVLVVRIQYVVGDLGPAGTKFTGIVTQNATDLVYIQAMVTP